MGGGFSYSYIDYKKILRGFMKTNNKDCIKKMIDGKEVKIVKHNFLPSGTIALSTDLYNKLKEEKKDDD